jgi:BTB/POZ domain-containing protein KCTD9
MTNHHPTKAELRDSFKNISNTHDRLQHEYDLVREAKTLRIPVDEYRGYYELRGEISFIDELPREWSPIKWGKYMFSRLLTLRKPLKYGTIFGSVLATGGPMIWGIARYIYEAPQREKQAYYQAWQIINSVRPGEASDSGRTEALQDLVQRKFPLKHLNITNAQLGDIQLPKANLNQANLNSVNLVGANLEGAALIFTNLSNANLSSAKLSGAIISADLSGVNLSGTDLGGAHLEGATNINPEQIKKARNWQEACYDPDLLQKLKISQNPQCDEKMEN